MGERSRSDNATVATAMLREPTLHHPDTTVAELHRYFADPHVHAALIVDAGRLVAVVERVDLADLPASPNPVDGVGRLTGRTVAPDAGLADTLARMRTEQRRRLAVVDGSGRLLGLLALKRTGRGFCSDADIADRRTAPG